MLTFLIIEPHTVLRQSLRCWLEFDLAPGRILEAQDLTEALALAAGHPPGVILVDLDGLAADDQEGLRRLGQLYPEALLLGMGLDETPAHRERAARAGFAVFIPKAQLPAELLRALREERKA